MIMTLLMLAATAAAEPTAATEVRRRDRELNALIAAHAVRRAEPFYADAFVLTTSSGRSKRKPELLAEIGSDALTLEINETRDVAVRVLDHTAVLTGMLHQRGSYGGKAFDVELRVTDTWVFAGGEWRLLAGHASAVPVRT
jgi:hypothetical protein